MFPFLNSLFTLIQGWDHPFLVILTACVVTVVIYKGYKNLKLWFYDNHKYILYAFIEAIYLPFLVFIWLAVFRLTCHLLPASTLDFILSMDDNLGLQRISLLIFATWFMMRFITSMQHEVSLNYMKQPRIMTFLFRLFYYMLVLLSITGALNLLGITLSEKLTAVGYSFIIINFVVVLLYFSHVVFSAYAGIFSSKNFFFRQILIQALRDPIKLLIVGVGLNFIIKTWQPLGYLSFISHVFSVIQYSEIALLSLFWMLYKFTILVEEHLLLGHLTERYPDKVMVKTVGQFSRIVLIIIGIFIFFSRITIDKSVLNLFGGSAVFFGIVGKDIFPSYLSGLFIYFEDRFKIGDWIYSADQKIEGTIESMDLRSTSIRTFDKRLLVVPNTLIASNAFCNASKMTNRRIRETIRVERVSYEQLAKIIQDIRVMLENHSGIDQEQRRMVHFVAFGTYSFDIDLYTFTKTTDWQTYRNVQQDVFLKVMEIIDNNGAKLAFPTRTVYVHPSELKQTLVK